MQSAKREAS